MKVAHVIQRYWPCVGGAERYFQELSERLASDGHQVTVYTTDIWDLEGFWARGKARVSSKEEEHNEEVDLDDESLDDDLDQFDLEQEEPQAATKEDELAADEGQ